MATACGGQNYRRTPCTDHTGENNRRLSEDSAMDPLYYFLYEEFIDPGMKYECQNCGTLFGDECMTWNEEAQCHITVCPGCGSQLLLGAELDDGQD